MAQPVSRRALLRSAFLGSSGVLAAYLFGGNDGGADLNDLWELSVPL